MNVNIEFKILNSCSKAKKNYKNTLINEIIERLKDLSLEQLIKIDKFIDNDK